MWKRRVGGGLLAFALVTGAAMAADKDKKKDEPPPPPDPTMVECTVPFRPAIVLDGRTATEEQMLALASRVKHYQAQLTSYRACLNPLMNSARTSGDNARDSEIVKQYNDSVAAETEVVNAYNAILAKHRAAQGLPPLDKSTKTARNG
ncbi:MAG: hypothetical protein WAW96_21055 [Alphaproteobacteria bacterium]